MNCRTSMPLVASAVGLALFSVPAAAQEHALREGYSRDAHKVVVETRIPVSDIDPASAKDAQILLARIETAAARVCGGTAVARSDYQAREFRDCRDAAVSEAVARMRSPALTTLASQTRPGRGAGR